MPLYKRPDSDDWWIDIRHNKRRIRRSTGTANKAAAQEFHDRVKAQLWRQAKLQELPQRTWGEAVKRWLLENAGLRSLTDRKDHLRWLTQQLGADRPLASITRETAEELIAIKLAEPVRRWKRGATASVATDPSKTVSPSTVNRYTAALSAVLHAAAAEWNWLPAAPKIRKLGEPEGRTRYLTREQVVCLIAELPDHLAGAAALALTTGLRMSNVIRLPWRKVDLARRCAWVDPADAKGGDGIAVPLNNEAIAVLRDQLQAQAAAETAAGVDVVRLAKLRKAHEFVFTFRGQAIAGGASNHAWRKALARAAITDFRWHDWRHTWASWHTMSGTPTEVLQQLGAWKDPKMVQRYAHRSPGYLAQFAANLRPYDASEKDTATEVAETMKRASG